ncbi:hypothetical protein BO94DRAFT_254605 [Aspergillus sclerotioniger CBS 115572]|uniref:Uncharacterized protein n=1 Tax=Aspergillus sclerotioniger CBS 115572 TaxID=1450535 RepID=A0A317VF22_9EURO|nr:hypothetical protein BO94DRAFT_254605 [Aspergillus sclerotioniger CBS 115572]PWY71801.1 hypothetical protein BO94DRAFT_254605 [Aspergillus sclerotioniger CBS 115572]
MFAFAGCELDSNGNSDRSPRSHHRHLHAPIVDPSLSQLDTTCLMSGFARYHQLPLTTTQYMLYFHQTIDLPPTWNSLECHQFNCHSTPFPPTPIQCNSSASLPDGASSVLCTACRHCRATADRSRCLGRTRRLTSAICILTSPSRAEKNLAATRDSGDFPYVSNRTITAAELTRHTDQLGLSFE